MSLNCVVFCFGMCFKTSGDKNKNKSENGNVKYKLRADYNLKDNEMFPFEHSIRMLISSSLIIIPTMIAYFMGHTFLSISSFIVVFSSMNHWRYPLLNTWRRTFDMICVHFGFWSHLFYGYNYISHNYYFYGYICFVLIGVFCYVNALFHGAIKHDPNTSSKFHVMLHISGVFGNSYLYFCLYHDL